MNSVNDIPVNTLLENDLIDEIYAKLELLEYRLIAALHKKHTLDALNQDGGYIPQDIVEYPGEITFKTNVTYIQFDTNSTDKFVNKQYIRDVFKNYYSKIGEDSIQLIQTIPASYELSYSPIISNEILKEEFLLNSGSTITDCSVLSKSFYEYKDNELVGFDDASSEFFTISDTIDISNRIIESPNGEIAISPITGISIPHLSLDTTAVSGIYIKHDGYLIRQGTFESRYATFNNPYLNKNAALGKTTDTNTVSIASILEKLKGKAPKNWRCSNLIKTDSKSTGLSTAIKEAVLNEGDIEHVAKEAVTLEEFEEAISKILEQISISITGECDG